MCTADSRGFGSVAEALRVANATMDYLNGSAAADLETASCGGVLRSLGEIQAKFTAARASVLSRFDAADAHDADGYGTSVTWLRAMAKMRRKDAGAAVRLMRKLRMYPALGAALATAEISASWAEQILDWIGKLPGGLRHDAEAVARIVEILMAAAAAGATLEDLEAIFARTVVLWRAEHPDTGDDDGFEDRYVQVASTFDGAGVLRGDLTPECAAAVQAVLEALGKKAGPEDTRTDGQRFHDALQLGCELLIRARMVPDRAGADTQVMVHVALSQLRDMPGASVIEDAWLRGEPGYLSGKDAEAAACDALTVPVVTGRADMMIIDKIIALALAAGDHDSGPDGGAAPRSLSPEAHAALRHAIGRLAIDFVSGPDGIAAMLRTRLLAPPFNTPSLPLDIGWSESIPAHIRRAVTARDKHCAWPRCRRRVAWCDVHHLVHKEDGGDTSAENCVLLCQFHHDIAIHRWGWQLTLHPDGTTTARGPHGQVLHSHGPPGMKAA